MSNKTAIFPKNFIKYLLFCLFLTQMSGNYCEFAQIMCPQESFFRLTTGYRWLKIGSTIVNSPNQAYI